MSEIYLLPENVRPSDAQMVLAFLNAAQSAEEIATAVEIPQELDVGLRVAARILAAREQLGQFTSLEQVYAVPYVGPERFTELVVCLSSARPPQPSAGLTTDTALTRLSQRLQALEAQVGGGASIRLTAINADALLGQETLLLAELKDANGRPLVDHPLTLVTTWGVLRGRVGTREVRGNSLTLHSDHLGLCKVRLSAALGESLTAVESASLTRALADLGPLTDAPRDNQRQLRQLADAYRAPGNDALRRAIDVYFKGYGEQSAIPTDSLSHWPRIAVTLVAWLTPDPGQATSQVPVSLLSVHQRNWFYAWLWAYRQRLEGSSLIASLGSVSGDDRSGSGILSDLYARVGGFVKAQPGLVGRQLGQTFAAQSLNQFLQSGLDKFPQETRTKVVTGITSGVKSLINTQPFSTLESSRTDLNLELDAKVAGIDASSQIADLESRVSSVEQSALTQADLTLFETNLLNQFNQTLTTSLDDVKIEFATSLEGKADVTLVNKLDQQVTSLKTFNSGGTEPQ